MFNFSKTLKSKCTLWIRDSLPVCDQHMVSRPFLQGELGDLFTFCVRSSVAQVTQLVLAEVRNAHGLDTSMWSKCDTHTHGHAVTVICASPADTHSDLRGERCKCRVMKQNGSMGNPLCTSYNCLRDH